MLRVGARIHEPTGRCANLSFPSGVVLFHRFRFALSTDTDWLGMVPDIAAGEDVIRMREAILHRLAIFLVTSTANHTEDTGLVDTASKKPSLSHT